MSLGKEKTSLHPILPEADVQALVVNYLADPIFDNLRVLVLIPDQTRTAAVESGRRDPVSSQKLTAAWPVTADTVGGGARCDGLNRNKDA
jgi:hypothetical protein